jgi:hypothetical protein
LAQGTIIHVQILRKNFLLKSSKWKNTYLYLSHKGLMPIFFSPNCSFSVCGTAAVVAAVAVVAVAAAVVVGDGVNGSFADWH